MSQKINKVRDEDFKPVSIAGEGERWPTFIRQFNAARGEYYEDMGVLVDPLTLFSTRPEEEVQGEAWRNMPSPGMMKISEEGHLMRLPESERHAQMLLGEPGCGKTFLFNHLAKLRDARGLVEVSCANRDLSDLFYQNVLDYDAGKDLYDAIDERLAKKEVKPLSLNILKRGLGSAVSVDDEGRVSVDWRQAGQITEDKNTEPTEENRALYLKRKEEALEKAKQAIFEFAQMEQMDQDGGSMSIGLTTIEGPMIRAWKENRPILLDEFNKAKYGHDTLHQVIQVYIGEKEEFIAEGGNGQTFTFRASERPINHELNLTGNLLHDGASTVSLSESFYQRAQPIEVPDADKEDMAHRFCQWVAGGPVTTAYKINRKWADEDPKGFTDYLMHKRKQGLSDEKLKNIPSLQWSQLKNWRDLNTAALQLGEFYDKWQLLLDEDSDLYAAGNRGNPILDGILQEIDEDYCKRVSPGMRLMKKHLDTAHQNKPRSISIEQADKQGHVTTAQPQANLEEAFGDNLCHVIMDSIAETTHGKPMLRKQLLHYAEEAGIFRTPSREHDLVDAESHRPLLAELLNANPSKGKLAEEEVSEIHSILCGYIRERFGDKVLDGKSNEDIISLSALKEQLEHILSEDISRETARSSVLHLLSLDTQNLHDQPFTGLVSSEQKLPENKSAPRDTEEETRLKQTQEGEDDLDNLVDINTASLVDSQRLLVSLSLPSIGRRNLSALWNDHGPHFATHNGDEDRNLMAIGKDSSGLSVNLLRCKTVDAEGVEMEEYLYVVDDRFSRQGKGETLITGTQDISDSMSELLQKQGITYVNRHADDATEIVADFINQRIEKRAANIRSELAIQKQASELLRSLTAAISTRFAYADEEGVVVNKEGEETSVPKLRFAESLPHPLVAYGDYGNDSILAPFPLSDEIEKARENLLAVLTDRSDTLGKFQSDKKVRPFVVTASPDMESLKHTLKYLNRDSDPNSMGQVA